MYRPVFNRILMVLTLLLGVMSVATAADRVYIDAPYIEPGTMETIILHLDNEVPYYGFQMDITLPKGLKFIVEDENPSIILSSRANSSYSLVSNVISLERLRIGTFSTAHLAISGTTGALMFIKVIADDEFVGGELSLANIHLVSENDLDIALPDYTLSIRNQADNKCYIPDFTIAVGQTKTVSLVLDNETPFTAFQTDVYLPDGMNIVADSFKATSRTANHTVSAKSFSDGRTRIICFSPSSSVITPGVGVVLEFNIYVSRDMEETCSIDLKNQICSTSSAEECLLPNTVTEVTVSKALVSEIIIDPIKCDLNIGETFPLSVTINPSYATNKEIEWGSDVPSVATVSSSGTVTAVGDGTTIISATACDGSNVSASCAVTVNSIPVSSIILSRSDATLQANKTVQLTATINPSNASDKSLIWMSKNTAIAVANQDGLVTGVGLGETDIVVSSASNPAISSQCHITVVPTPVSAITLSTSYVQLKATESAMLEVQIAPEDATDKSLTWTSTDSSIATVDTNGTITAITVGEVQIKATANDGSGVSATCNLLVIHTPVESVSVTANGTTSLKVGQTVQLNATVLPETATDKSFVWSSSNQSTATVNNEGIVTAMSVGNTLITASAGEVSSSINITVEKTLAEAITLNRTTAEMIVHGTLQLFAVFTPETTTDKSVSWSSSNPVVASVDEYGVVTAHSLGECSIIATTNDGSDVSACCDVTVGETAAESIVISPVGPFSFKVGESIQLTATVIPETATDKSVNWQSQSSAVNVDEDGLVTAITVGTARITATNSAGQVAYADFTVVPTFVTSITLSSTSVQLKSMETVKIDAQVIPAEATDKSLTWTSSNTNVATVDAFGTITAISVGETQITATANDGSGVTAICNISVIPTPAESVVISASGSTTLKVGQTVQLNAKVLPETATDKSVVWNSSDASVAYVSNEGLVTAVNVGNIIVTATVGDVSSSINIAVDKTYIESIEITADTSSIHVGESIMLTATILPETATDKTLKWSLSEDGIVAIKESNGNKAIIEAIAPEAVIVIASTQDGITNSYLLEVLPNLATSLTIDNTSAKLSVGEMYQLIATVLPENTTNKSLKWASSNPDVATVDESGIITAVKSGLCEISVSTLDSSDLIAVCSVEVIQYITDIALSEHSLLMHPLETFTLVATIEPIDATDKSVLWQSSHTEVADVDSYGLITANQEGEAIISVKTLDGSDLTDECMVTVKKDALGIETITMDNVKITLNCNSVAISGINSGTTACLYSIDGILLNTATSNGLDVRFDIVPNKYYVLKVGKYSLKLISK